MYHATWRGLSKNIEEITKSLQRHKGIIERQATLVEYEQFQEFRAQTKAEFAKLQLAERDRRYFFVQRWLCPIDSRARDEAAGRERFPDTGLWLLQNQCFQDWFAPDRCMDPLLWLCGMPGAGGYCTCVLDHTLTMFRQDCSRLINRFGSEKVARRSQSVLLLQTHG